jgi:hypothetical protein
MYVCVNVFQIGALCYFIIVVSFTVLLIFAHVLPKKDKKIHRFLLSMKVTKLSSLLKFGC